MRLWFVIIILFVFSSKIFCQNPYGRISIKSGGVVNFVFSTLSKYKNGSRYTNFSRIDVYFNDTANDGSAGIEDQWKLTFHANSANIIGDDGNFLDLETIELKATGTNINGNLVYYLADNGFQPLDAATTDLVWTTGAGVIPYNETIYITYACGQSNATGVTNTLLGKPADHYGVDIILTLYWDP